jgi:hypothetical protein
MDQRILTPISNCEEPRVTKKTLWGCISLGIALVSVPTHAEPFKDIEVHAFLSQGFIKTTDNEYLTKSHLGSFDFSEFGINFTRQLGEDFRTGVQIFSRKLGPNTGFDAKLDWFYLDYHPSDRLGLRFGRIKLPFGLYNASSDVDAARVPILLPQSVYPTQNRDYLLAQTGFELYGTTGRASAGLLEYRVYGGTIFIDVANTPGSTVQIQDLNVPYVAGSRLLWETPFVGLRLAGSIQALRLDTSAIFNSTLPAVTVQIPALLWVGSAEYAKNDLTLTAEYSRWNLKSGNSSNPTLFPETSVTSERAYAMASYRLESWLVPGLYYSVLFSNVDLRSARQGHQHDLAATLRFDLNSFWLVKLEGHYMRGTASLSSSLNGNVPASALKETWGAFLVKTTAYF